MNFQLDRWMCAISYSEMPATVKLVLYTLAIQSNYHDPAIDFIDTQSIAERSGLNAGSVAEALSHAQRHGWVKISHSNYFLGYPQNFKKGAA